MGLPALALVLAVGLLHTQVSKHGWKIQEKHAGLSCKGSGGTAPGSALLLSLCSCSSCYGTLLLQPLRPTAASCLWSLPSQHPSPKMPPAQLQGV